jgi:cytochrome c oxidase subunit 2
VGNNLEEEKIGSISLRNRNEQGQNGEQFEKKVKIEDVDIADEKVDANTSNESLTVTVLANQDSWEFTYSNTEIVTSNELVVPLNEKVNFNLMPSDSGHSFWIPAVGGKMDTSTDKTNEFWLEFDMEKANEPDGIFYGKSAEHGSGMDFKVKAIPRDEFNQWVEESNN